MEQQGVQLLERVDSPGGVQTDLSPTKGVLWLMAAKTAAFVLSLAVPLLIVRQLTVREFGIYKQLFLFLDTAMIILSLGFSASAFYFFPREPAKKAGIVGNILVFHILMGALGGMLVVVFPALPATVLNSHELAAFAPVIGIAIVLLVGSSFVETLVIANGEIRLAALVTPTMQLLRSGVLVAAAILWGSIHALAYAALAYGFMQYGIMVSYVRSRFSRASHHVGWDLMRAQIAYALPLAYANAFLMWLQTSAHNYFVSNRYGAAAYAVYAVGCFQLPIVGIALDSVGSVVIQRISDLRSRNETRKIVHLAAQTVRTLAAVMLPLYFLLLVVGQDLITILFTERYRASWPIFAVNLTLIPLSIAAPVCDAVFRAYPERLSILLKTRTALLAPLLGGLWIATHRLGLVGPIAVVVAVTLAERVAIAIAVGGILGMSWRDLGLFRGMAKLAVAGGVAGVGAILAREILLKNRVGDGPVALLVISAGIFAVVFVGAALLLRVLAPEEQETIGRWLARAHQAMPWRTVGDATEQRAREPLG
jgi:O-antigen/teichoic acid export membrane protein